MNIVRDHSGPTLIGILSNYQYMNARPCFAVMLLFYGVEGVIERRSPFLDQKAFLHLAKGEGALRQTLTISLFAEKNARKTH